MASHTFIHCEPYAFGVVVCYMDSKRFSKFIKKRYQIDFEDSHTGGMYFEIEHAETKESIRFIRITPTEDKIELINSVSHEWIHAMLHVFADSGAKFDADNNEHFAYSVGTAIQKTLEFLQKNKHISIKEAF